MTTLQSSKTAKAPPSGKICPRHGYVGCSCGMGNLFRFVEPLILSEWTESVHGAGRKSYRLTTKGNEHLDEWADLLEALAGGLRDFVKDARKGGPKRGKVDPAG